MLFHVQLSSSSLRESISCLRLLPNSLLPSTIPSVSCLSRQFLPKIWLICLSLISLTVCRLLPAPLLYTFLHYSHDYCAVMWYLWTNNGTCLKIYRVSNCGHLYFRYWLSEYLRQMSLSLMEINANLDPQSSYFHWCFPWSLQACLVPAC